MAWDALRFEDVTFAYERGAPVVSNVSFSLPRGGRLAVMGANGSGKSTLIQLACGLLQPTAGRVTRARVGYVAQDPYANVVGETVREDVLFGLERGAPGASSAELERRAHEALARVGMAHAIDRPMASLSGGEVQRVALAAALSYRVDVLALDEPTSHLPREEARLFWASFVRAAGAGGFGIVLVTHHPHEARYAEHVLVMARGRIAAAGPARSLLGRARILEPIGVRADVYAELGDLLGIECDYGDPASFEEGTVKALCSSFNL